MDRFKQNFDLDFHVNISHLVPHPRICRRRWGLPNMLEIFFSDAPYFTDF